MGFFQEISNRTHWTDLEKTWVSNSSSNFVWGPLGRSHSNFDGIFGGFKFWWNFGGEILTAITLLIFVDLWYSTIPLPKIASPGFSKWINTGYKPVNPGKNSRNCHYCKRGSHLQRAVFHRTLPGFQPTAEFRPCFDPLGGESVAHRGFACMSSNNFFKAWKAGLQQQTNQSQWLYLVPLIGGRWYIIPQLAVYTTYILPIGWLYATYHLLREPVNSIEKQTKVRGWNFLGVSLNGG